VKLYQGPGDSIAATVNPRREMEILGLPLWLVEEGKKIEEAKELIRVLDEINPDMFFKEKNRMLLQAYKNLHSKNKIPSLSSVQSQLSLLGFWTDIEADMGGHFNNTILQEYIEKGACPLTFKFEYCGLDFDDYYFEILYELQELHTKRTAIYLTENIYNEAMDSWKPETPFKLIKHAQEIIAKLSQPNKDESPYIYYKDVAKQTVDLIDEKRKGEFQNLSVDTGFGDLDEKLGGLFPGNLLILAGRPGMGKTALALDIGKYISDHNEVVLFFSMEMTKDEIIHRIISKQLHIELSKLRSGDVTEYQVGNMYDRIDKDKDCFWIVDKNLTPNLIEAKMKEAQEKRPNNKIRVIIIDHLQILGVSDTSKHESRHRQLAAYTTALKDLAKNYSITVILLSQLNRNVEGRTLDQRSPKLSDLRESGSIEENADIVLGLWRKFIDSNNDIDKHQGLLRILKNRNGPLNNVPLYWTPQFASFSSIDNIHEDDGIPF
jgi:replicative DNA helicase